MTQSNRPLSPHLQVYRPQITSVLSIAHRITGIGLAAGGVLLSLWLIAVASGPDSLARFNNLMGSGVGLVVLSAIAFCFFYHLANGIRHLFWDAGWGFEIGQVSASGIAVLVAAFAMTAGFLLSVLT